MDKKQLALIEIEVALGIVIKSGMNTLDTYRKPRTPKKDVTDEKFVPHSEIFKEIKNFKTAIFDYSQIDDLNDLGKKISKLSHFTRSYLDDQNLIISMAAREMHPRLSKLKSLINLSLSYPDEVIRRAKTIMNQPKERKTYELL